MLEGRHFTVHALCPSMNGVSDAAGVYITRFDSKKSSVHGEEPKSQLLFDTA
jgi:hypothetical protein